MNNYEQNGTDALTKAVLNAIAIGDPVMTAQGTIRQVTDIIGCGYQVLGLGLFNEQSIRVMADRYKNRESR